MQLYYSFIIPVYNRPEEVGELLGSMVSLNFRGDYEIVIIEDGSTIPCNEVVEKYNQDLNIHYLQKSNTGPGHSRNFGMKAAKGNYFLILDSDVILPPDYLQQVNNFLTDTYFDCFGGPDAADESFTITQKAINYSMTSLLTTGGIRGQNRSVNKFEPRSFNMGLSKEAFERSGGFGNIHPGEDPDLSLRLEKLGFKTTLVPEAVVYHKRRIDWNKFYKQVFKFGKVRPILNLWHPGSAKFAYWFPSVFITGLIVAVILLIFGIPQLLFLYLVYFILIGVGAAVKNKSFNIGIAAVFATLIQFCGYGIGFINSVWKIFVLKKDPQTAFPELFFNGTKKN